MRLIDADKFLTQIEDQYMEHELTKSQYRDLEDRIMQQPTIKPLLTEYDAWFCIGETLVDESKGHITAKRACEKIREYLFLSEAPERRKKGHWMIEGRFPQCSECGKISPVVTLFCPNCGADMRGEKE